MSETKLRSTQLPYVNRGFIILFVAALNLAIAFAFQFGRPINALVMLVDAGICGITTSIIGVAYTYVSMRRLRAKGALPQNVPVQPLMSRLPKNPVGLIAVFAVVFALIMLALTKATLWFFEISDFVFVRFAVWKVVYSVILSAKIIELAVLRFVQPDCASKDDPPQIGQQTVKNPLPRRSTFKELFSTVTNDFGLNMILGLVFGSTLVIDHNVVILPTTRAGIVISGLILGVIVTVCMVYPLAKQVCMLRETQQLPAREKRSAGLAWLPQTPLLFALVLLLPVMLLSACVLWAALTFFGFETLNFFQFFVVRTIYVTLLSKPVLLLALLRYSQPEKAATEQAPTQDAAL